MEYRNAIQREKETRSKKWNEKEWKAEWKNECPFTEVRKVRFGAIRVRVRAVWAAREGEGRRETRRERSGREDKSVADRQRRDSESDQGGRGDEVK